jgi:UDP-glucose 4-epimerase
MDMKKVLITGANGYLGAQISQYLASAGFRVSGLCYPQIPENEAWRQSFEHLFVCDIREADKLKAIAQHRYDAVVHLVSLDHHQSCGDPAFVASVNITPTWNLLDIFSRSGLQKFVYFSTVHVYGTALHGGVTEDYPVNCANPYALTHYVSETICRYYAANSPVACVIARLANSYGHPVFPSNNCWWLAVNDLCRMAYREKKLTLHSDGSPLRDFIYGKDVCQAVHLLIEQGENGGTYHVSSGETHSILELATTVQSVYRELYGAQIPVAAAPLDNPTPSHYTIDNSRLKKLGFQPEYSLERGINALFGSFSERGAP